MIFYIPNRVCVALSRAKRGLFVFGNFNFLSKNCKDSNLWTKIRDSVKESESLGAALPIKCQQHGIKQFISTPEQFDQLSVEGGCPNPCNKRLDCGHTCVRSCHVYDIEHKKMPCTKPCPRSYPLNHPCAKLCNQVIFIQ